MESAVGPLVKAKVEDRIKEAEDQEKVAEIADEVINSKEYVGLLLFVVFVVLVIWLLVQ